VIRHLLLATTNAGKLREIRDVLAGLDIDVSTLADFPAIDEAEEHGATFVENARAKALHYAAGTGRLVVAEDSGLEIDALDGAPGVQSARFAAAEAPGYPEKFALIYRLLRERTGKVESTARFVYDPIFYYPPFDATLAEVDAVRKASVSHRGQAFGRLKDYLQSRR
jgi:XTP/dITP diphosphohydrolase